MLRLFKYVPCELRRETATGVDDFILRNATQVEHHISRDCHAGDKHVKVQSGNISCAIDFE